MTEIIGIQFKNSGRVYYFSPIGMKFNVGDYAVVETVRGIELGRVIIANRTVEDDEVEFELKDVIRKATDYDIRLEKKHEEMAPASFDIFKKYVSELELPMKPLYCEYTIDSSKIIFYYSADDRVDFRELLKVLTPNFRLRIELRQVGPREAARYIGGIGTCGREVCCASCLNSFDYVTMKMAKDQGMSLNTSKISGICGKLMCCIAYEHEMYLEAKKELPQIGEMVKTCSCSACKVVAVDYVKRIVSTEESLNGSSVKHPMSEVTRLTQGDVMRHDAELVTSIDEKGKIEEKINKDAVEQDSFLKKEINEKKPNKKPTQKSSSEQKEDKKQEVKEDTKTLVEEKKETEADKKQDQQGTKPHNHKNKHSFSRKNNYKKKKETPKEAH